MEIFASLIAATLSMLAGFLVSSKIIEKLVNRLLSKPLPQKSYSQRLSELTIGLRIASAEVDSFLNELGRVAKEKENSVHKFEQDLIIMEQKEKELKNRIKELENIPIPVVEHFVKLLEAGEKRSKWRDYILFGAGVIVTTVVTITIQAF